MPVYDEFYKQLTAKQDFAARAISDGALYAYAWAKRNPDKVSCIYAETAVCDLRAGQAGNRSGKYIG